ncbi:hypothetical protein GQ457_02G030990 [Hibiscus cannabinus]
MSIRGLKLAVPPEMQQNPCLELNNGGSSRARHVGSKISGCFVFSALLSVLRPRMLLSSSAPMLQHRVAHHPPGMLWHLFLLSPYQIHWKGLWQVFDRHGIVVDSFIPQKRDVGGSRFGFVRMKSEVEAVRALLDYPVQVRHETKPAQVRTEPAQTDSIAGVLGVTQPEFLDLLGRCAIGWCRIPIPNRVLAAEMRAEGINDSNVMRISGNRVLIISDSIEERDRIVSSGVMSTWFERVENWKSTCGMEQSRVWLSVYGVPIHVWTKDTFERIAAIGGSVICVEEETLDLTSFERGRVLIESPSLTRVEFKVDLKVLDVVFPVRVSEVELFLRGPRVSHVVQGNRSDGGNSDSEDMMAKSAASDVGNGLGRDRTVGECQGESGGAIHGVDAELGGTVVPYRGTASDVIMYRGSRRKVRLLNDVIRSVQSPAEVLANAKRKGKGRGRPRKEGEVSVRWIAPNSPSVIADILITDSDVNCRQSAILREAKATIGLGAVSKRRAVQALLRKHEVEMAFFQETKLVEITDRLVKQVWWSDSFAFDFVPSIGLSGGILVVYDPSKFVAAMVTHDPNFMCLCGHWVSDSWESLMIAVYASCVRSERLDFWERLLAVPSAVEIPCCLGGDFNEVTDYAEHRGCVGDRGGMLEFVGFIHDGGFVRYADSGESLYMIETTTALLNDLDDRVNEFDDENIFLMRKVQGDLWRLLRNRESIWCQKSRVLWLREGNRNTKVDRDRFELPFSVTEVWDVIRNSEGSKAPAALPQVDIQALFAQLNANLDARFTSLNEDVNARFNSIDARLNSFETRFKAHEDTLHLVETELSAYYLEWSTHTFGVGGLGGGEDEDDGSLPLI